MKLLTFPFQKNISPESPHQPHWRVLAVLGALATGAGLSLTYFLSRPQPEAVQVPPTETFSLSGQVKGNETKIAALLPGRVEWVAVHKGDDVEQGQVVIQLSSKNLQTQLETVRAQLGAAEQHKQQVEAEREVIREKLWDAYLKLRPDESELDQWVRDADRTILATETELAEARAELQRAKTDSGDIAEKPDRATPPQRQTPKQQQINQLEARVQGLEQELRLARGAWVRALSTGLSPYIHSPELDALRQQWVQVLAKLADAEEAVFQLTSKEQQLEAQNDRLTLTSPRTGIVTECEVEPGDAVGIGKPLMTIADSNSLYLEAYIPDEAEDEAQSSQQAQVFLDSDPGQPLNVHVVAIDSSASVANETENLSDRSPSSSSSSSILIQLSVDHPNRTTVPGNAVEGEIVFIN